MSVSYFEYNRLKNSRIKQPPNQGKVGFRKKVEPRITSIFTFKTIVNNHLDSKKVP